MGTISCEAAAGYPPGVPSLLPGKQITAEVVAYLRARTAEGARSTARPNRSSARCGS
ncbi:MAG: hypothetical protein JOY56_05880 [Solirubrobacterales bacterium]|nr:hypothetical protein [Solirubrobacterales bacterium]MBV9363521.1 hypothetical protein [Solirubrobacterales bacterium]